ncbi:putative hydrolase of the HAD superfamily [Actinokineospora iranica]|uniref:Putative hydrolase of the HAD superfamily n=1 Tax=Actinokineospora iranica TaxID=1271860 RepID=A0A1G6W0R5_9PSEU|nr:putative hydrolase of the HAD superfamily [Actinokineospora iranica]
MVRGVLFDFNGTLARSVAWGVPHREVFERHGLRQAGRLWGDEWSVLPADGETHEEHSRDHESYRRWELDRLRRRALVCGVPPNQVDALVADLYRESRALTMRRYDDAVEALARLDRLGVVSAICSNWYWELDEAIEQAGLAGTFAVTVTSAHAGWRKPDPRIYQRTLRECDLRPAEALFVGDMWGPDVLGPRAVGMRAVHLCRPKRAVREVPPPLLPGVWRVSGLSEVVDLVEGLTC